MEDHKLRYLQNFLYHNPEYHLKDYIKKAKSWENKARKCYDKDIKLNTDKFIEMMLLDGIFVIQLFLMSQNDQLWLQDDPIFGKPHMLNDVRRDMALLENQLPFFIVKKLFGMAIGMHEKPKRELLELVCLFFGLEWAMESEVKCSDQVKHFVHAISLSFLPSVRKEQNQNNEKTKFTPSATELEAAGVKLKKCKRKCLLDIEFKNGVLNIPYLALDDSTEYYFRNIIAFEQCYCKNRYLTDYVAFMDCLVDTPGDAELLINKDIIENWLSNKEAVAQLLNALGKEVELSRDHHFNSLSDKLIKHCQRPHNKWKATFKRDYCSSPWVVISVIAAVALLLLTVAQTVLSALSLK
ncbi:hypothetical protein BT93_C0588 [Corymbia citriodora subsp. variegata]|nr:hypothetical protein BT93_C0588 [Corymbia citriodora subsp. variegata]